MCLCDTAHVSALLSISQGFKPWCLVMQPHKQLFTGALCRGSCTFSCGGGCSSSAALSLSGGPPSTSCASSLSSSSPVSFPPSKCCTTSLEFGYDAAVKQSWDHESGFRTALKAVLLLVHMQAGFGLQSFSCLMSCLPCHSMSAERGMKRSAVCFVTFSMLATVV